jgi:DNA-binding NtrC family response regulator
VLFVLGLITESNALSSNPAGGQLELHAGLLRLRDQLYRRYGYDRIVGTSHAMRRVQDQVRIAVETDARVFIWGEAGTGKELIARTIHSESRRRSAPFVPIDCAVVPAEVLEADLFGCAAAASELLAAPRPGLMQRAPGGTIYLKNLSRLPRDLQAQLAAWLYRGSAGDAELADAPTGLRIIASDRCDPDSILAQGDIRPDLHAALSTLLIHLPPLRDRKDDLALLGQMFIEAANSRQEKQVAGLSVSSLELLVAYDWPGNVRELEQVILDAHRRTQAMLIDSDDLTPRIKGEWGAAYAPPRAAEQAIDLDAVLLKAEKKLIELALRKARGNKSRAAELLSISRPRLYRRMEMLEMDTTDPPEASLMEATEESPAGPASI